jgi:hypothetical protein
LQSPNYLTNGNATIFAGLSPAATGDEKIHGQTLTIRAQAAGNLAVF